MPGEDPRPGLVEKLLSEIPTDGCIISYTDFETKRLRELAERFPGHKEKLDQLINNVRDLALPFKDMAYYHWKMNGSYSLKAVLPVLIPDMGYDGLEIRDGGMAIEAYFRMQESNNPEEIEKIRRALLVYCKLDTLAMVKLLNKLHMSFRRFMLAALFLLLMALSVQAATIGEIKPKSGAALQNTYIWDGKELKAKSGATLPQLQRKASLYFHSPKSEQVK